MRAPDGIPQGNCASTGCSFIMHTLQFEAFWFWRVGPMRRSTLQSTLRRTLGGHPFHLTRRTLIAWARGRWSGVGFESFETNATCCNAQPLPRCMVIRLTVLWVPLRPCARGLSLLDYLPRRKKNLKALCWRQRVSKRGGGVDLLLRVTKAVQCHLGPIRMSNGVLLCPDEP